MIPASRELILKGFIEKARKEVTGLSSGMNQGFQSAVGLTWAWISFEAFTCGKYKKDLVKERIIDFCADFAYNYQRDYESMPDEFKRYMVGLKSYSILDMRPQHSTAPPRKINNVRNLKEVLEAIYRVRNNLLHGGKDMQEINDMTLVLCASKVLYYILEKVFQEEGIIN